MLCGGLAITEQAGDASYGFDPEAFVEEKVEEIRKFVGDGRAAIATSGGVDSTACAALAHRALGQRLICFFMDTGFMREGEVSEVRDMLSSLGLPLRVLSAKERFLGSLKGKADAEEKRIAFRQTFYTVLGEAAKEEGCDVLIQGTIAPDWIETSGGIKTQHNVLEQLGLDTKRVFGFRLMEPLLDLYKDQVRALAKYLGADAAASQRQPFPGPGLLVRCIGEATEEKIDVLRKATAVVEAGLKLADPEPKQYLAAVIEDTRLRPKDGVSEEAGRLLHGGTAVYLGGRATGVKGDNRAYGKIAVIFGEERDPEDLFGAPEKIIHKDPEVVRVLYAVAASGSRSGRYVVIIRAVETRDFMTVKPSPIPRGLLKGLAGEILKDGRVTLVCYDLTSKPPATVEFE